jgi:truncated hemoglobin YjbI
MKVIEKTINITTGEENITERDETAAEKKAREAMIKEIAAAQAEIETKATARQAIADRLGLTADELQVLLG